MLSKPELSNSFIIERDFDALLNGISGVTPVSDYNLERFALIFNKDFEEIAYQIRSVQEGGIYE